MVLAWGLSGCDDAGPSAPRPSASPRPTPLSAYPTSGPTSGVAVARALFCDRVSPTAIEHAIGGPAADSKQWVNGDELPSGQVGHEYGCRWTATDGGSAAAWVFAPPITRARAQVLAKSAPGMKCKPMPGPETPPFGDPSSAYVCGLNTGTTHVRIAGLFGDAWLTCEAPRGTIEEFCGAVLGAARAG